MFPDLNSGKEEEIEEDEEIIFYLWEENEILFEIYKVVNKFLSEYYVIPASFMADIIKEEGLPVRSSSNSIAYIHHGYVSIILAKDKHGREDT